MSYTIEQSYSSRSYNEYEICHNNKLIAYYIERFNDNRELVSINLLSPVEYEDISY